ncbi:hypothetical protein DKM44_12820 [Deinococcus irradiatisoli]|uniref:Phage tail protein n=1 Tax=Deinococcus irradiatisoli TaxID=2202254 RepID=A0A2Z3JTS8_9DEIO|nr:hypothetical protein [Deinococcus irradiatisoli]AWN24004.1 hypothetical protein DKM44_12820 [Deinococcus irradiatisoli]
MTTLDFLYGETSNFKFKVLSAPTVIRPVDFDTTALTLPELTTSDLPATVSTKTPATPKMYGSPADGTDITWQKPKPDTGSWTLSLSGNVLPSSADRANMNTFIAALGKYVWIERQMHTSAKNEGGCILVTSTGKPVPADTNTPVTFTAGGTGYGPKFDDTSLAV